MENSIKKKDYTFGLGMLNIAIISYVVTAAGLILFLCTEYRPFIFVAMVSWLFSHLIDKRVVELQALLKQNKIDGSFYFYLLERAADEYQEDIQKIIKIKLFEQEKLMKELFGSLLVTKQKP